MQSSFTIDLRFEKKLGHNKWQEGKLTLDEASLKIKAKKKGNRLSIKSDDGSYFRGLKQFEFFPLVTEKQIDLLYFYEMLESEDILTVRYDFCDLIFEGKTNPFVLQESFTKVLVESRKRREGPIFSLDDDLVSVPFGKKKLNKFKELKQQFEIAKLNMNQYQKGDAQVAQLFDVERLAKYYALLRIFNLEQGISVENQRWYYNGITGLLEPIGYISTASLESNTNDFYSTNAFRDSLFVNKYNEYLQEYFTGKKLKSIIDKVEKNREETLVFAKTVYENYHFEIEKLIKNRNQQEGYMFKKKEFISETKILSTSPMQQLQRQKLNIICALENSKVTISKGNYQVSDNIIIPKGYEFYIEAGTTIDLINQAKIISYSPVFAVGTEAKKITITSTDSSANGFTILQADKESKLQHVNFSNLSTLNYKGWILTGAVSFYESDVSISNCSFINNQCEDALNIIRSTFVVDSSLFKYTHSDAFDGDFCTGKVLNSSFENIGNDAIDFSGSNIYVENCQMLNVEDKGISIGENSFVEATNTTIKNAIIGISAKDLSTGKIDNVKLINCEYGFAIYQKKSEFGPASIAAKEIQFIEVQHEFVLDKNSKIELNGIINTGQKKIDIDGLFY
ncbi:MAG: right-handed parallel beta-helix repeat-containing protein [Flavobacteriales bacterium]|nr:right-handed parallel beta-helix repeat-containing protein [Flavobacteriales bacterium]